MATINLTIASGADDAVSNLPDEGWPGVAELVDAQKSIGPGWWEFGWPRFTPPIQNPSCGGLRFLNVAIPAGSTITAATLELYFNGILQGSPTTRVHADDHDNSAAWGNTTNTATGRPGYRTRTTAHVHWTYGAWGSTPGWKTSLSLVAVIQEVIDRAGWASGNALSLMLLANDESWPGANKVAWFKTIEAGATYAARLNITYTPPTPPSVTIRPPRLNVFLAMYVPAVVSGGVLIESPRLDVSLSLYAPTVSAVEALGYLIWLHGRERGVILGWNPVTGARGEARLLPTAVTGSITPSASSEESGHEADKAFDGDSDTAWRPENASADQWLQATLDAESDVDSVKVAFTEAEGANGPEQDRVRAIRIRPSAHQDTSRTATAICQELVELLTAHELNRAYVEVYETSPSVEEGWFWFDTGTSDYEGFGSDGADFLSTFAALAALEGIEVFASLAYLQNYLAVSDNDWQLETRRAEAYPALHLCPNKTGVLAWMDSVIATLLAYSIDGIDFVEPQWGAEAGAQVCWCDDCQSEFAAAFAEARFGQVSLESRLEDATPTLTTWEYWRAYVLTVALAADIAAVQDGGKTASVTKSFLVNPTGEVVSLQWHRALAGIDIDTLLDLGVGAPDEFVWDCGWQDKAAAQRDYILFCPEWGEYATRWALFNHNGRTARAIVRVGAYSTVAESGTAFSYGYDHTLSRSELVETVQGAAKGGALHFDLYCLDAIEDGALWDAVDDAWDSDEYNAVMLEVQYNDDGTWRPIGRQAWFNTRTPDFSSWTAHFTRKTEDELRVVLYPAPISNRLVYLKEVELRTHSIQATDNVWGGMDADNAESGTDDLWLARYTAAQPYLHRIDETTGLDAGGGPWAIDTQEANDLCVLPEGAEPRLLLLNQGDLGARSRLQRYSTAAPGTLVSSVYPNLGHKLTRYGGLAYQPASVDGTARLVIAVNIPGMGQRLYWADPETLVEAAGYADSEVVSLWASSLCWAYTNDCDFLFADANGQGAYLVRRVSLLTDGEADSDEANVITWDQSPVTLTVHPERMLTLADTSRRWLLRVCTYAWEDENLGYLAPTINAYAVMADGVETLVGAMTEEQRWGSVRMLTLYVPRERVPFQTLKLVATKAEGADYIGLLELAANMDGS